MPSPRNPQPEIGQTVRGDIRTAAPPAPGERTSSSPCHRMACGLNWMLSALSPQSAAEIDLSPTPATGGRLAGGSQPTGGLRKDPGRDPRTHAALHAHRRAAARRSRPTGVGRAVASPPRLCALLPEGPQGATHRHGAVLDAGTLAGHAGFDDAVCRGSSRPRPHGLRAWVGVETPDTLRPRRGLGRDRVAGLRLVVPGVHPQNGTTRRGASSA